MSSDLDRVEGELRDLRPRAMSDSLRAGIGRVMKQKGGTTRWRWLQAARTRPWTVAAAAAGLAVLLAAAVWLTPLRHRQGNGDCLFAASVLLGQQEEGTVMLAGDGPAFQVRRVFVDHAQWYDAKQDKLYSMTAPREEVLLVPMQVY